MNQDHGSNFPKGSASNSTTQVNNKWRTLAEDCATEMCKLEACSPNENLIVNY